MVWGKGHGFVDLFVLVLVPCCQNYVAVKLALIIWQYMSPNFVFQDVLAVLSPLNTLVCFRITLSKVPFGDGFEFINLLVTPQPSASKSRYHFEGGTGSVFVAVPFPLVRICLGIPLDCGKFHPAFPCSGRSLEHSWFEMKKTNPEFQASQISNPLH